MRKRILCLDFDGVIHAYTSGWQGAATIPDPPVPGAIVFLRAAVEHFSVAVFSSRSHQPGGIAAMQAWLAEWSARELPPGADLAFLEQLDDRALTFTGEWPSLEALQAFRPWYQRRAQE